MADRRYHVASILHQFHGPIYYIEHASSSFENGIVWTGPKRSSPENSVGRGLVFSL